MSTATIGVTDMWADQIGWECNGRILCWDCAIERYGNSIKDHTAIFGDEPEYVTYCEDCDMVLG